MKATVGRRKLALTFRGRLECVADDTLISFRTMFGAIRDPNGRCVAKQHGGFNRIVYRFFGAEADLTLQYGLLHPKYFFSENWRGDVTSDNWLFARKFCVGEKVFTWDPKEDLVRFTLPDPQWTLRDAMIAYVAYDYFNPPDGG